jgi:peptidylamidoglycolate lyase
VARRAHHHHHPHRVALLAVACAGACADETIEPAPSRLDPYEVAPGWPDPSTAADLGQCSGVGVDSRGRVLVFRRAERDWFGGPLPNDPIATPTIVVLDAESGEVVGALGAGLFVMPHGLTVGPDDDLWVTDVGTHEVHKLDRSGAVVLTLGERGVAGDDEAHFDRPTDVAVAEDGSIYVADGYGNARVVKLSASGEFLFSWGKPGDGPGELATPHSIALDGAGRVYVADRGNARVQVFEPDGRYVTEHKSEALGRPWALAFDRAGYAFVVDGGDQNLQPPDRARVSRLDPEGNLVTSFGSYGEEPGQMIWPHDVAVGQDGSIYVGEVGQGRRIQKFSQPGR